MLGSRPPEIRTPPPGAATRALVDRLAATECPALTTRRARRAERSGAPHDPIVWAEARGSNVVDTDGNVYVDLTSGFGVAAIGHAHPRVVEAVRDQAGRLLHALGDVHPSDVKVQLLERLAAIAPFDDARVILGLNGADAVEAALKTATLSTGRHGLLAFEGGYHGLTFAPLAACGYGPAFRRPFEAQLSPHVRFAPFPGRDAELGPALDAVEQHLARRAIGAVLVEPIQGRGGVNVPPADFLGELRALCDAHGALLVVDEIFTGLGRGGRRFLSADARPDLVTIGKALGGGLPVSACLGTEAVMRAWGDPDGEALHTATFLGNPIGCAAALAALSVLEEERLGDRARAVGERFRESLRALSSPRVTDVRGVGLIVGVELDDGAFALGVVRRLLERGYLALPAGPEARVLQLVPPLDVPEALLDGFVATLGQVLEA